MKYYPRDPDAAMGGMNELSFEQIGFYNLVLDLLYARDGIVPGDDAALAEMLRRDPRAVRRLKNELMAKGKIRLTNDGLLTANRVDQTLHLAEIRSISARHAVNVRWKNYRNAKEINGTSIQARNTSKVKSKYSEISTASETSGTDAVDEGENFGAVPPHSTTATAAWPPPTQSIGTGELEAVIRAKGWK